MGSRHPLAAFWEPCKIGVKQGLKIDGSASDLLQVFLVVILTRPELACLLHLGGGGGRGRLSTRRDKRKGTREAAKYRGRRMVRGRTSTTILSLYLGWISAMNFCAIVWVVRLGQGGSVAGFHGYEGEELQGSEDGNLLFLRVVVDPAPVLGPPVVPLPGQGGTGQD